MPRVVDAALHELLLQCDPPDDDDPVHDRLREGHDSRPEPAAAGTLTNPVRLPFDVQDQSGFDIAGAENLGYLATTTRRGGSGLYTVDPATGRSRFAGQIGGGRQARDHRPGGLAGLIDGGR